MVCAHLTGVAFGSSLLAFVLNLSNRSNSHAANFILEIVGPGSRPLSFALSIGIGIFHRPQNYVTIAPTQKLLENWPLTEPMGSFVQNTGKSK